jgi:hypothetical protein
MPTSRTASVTLLTICVCACIAAGQSVAPAQELGHAVEFGRLESTIKIASQPYERHDLRGEMRRLYVSEVSVAVIHHGQVEGRRIMASRAEVMCR